MGGREGGVGEVGAEVYHVRKSFMAAAALRLDSTVLILIVLCLPMDLRASRLISLNPRVCRFICFFHRSFCGRRRSVLLSHAWTVLIDCQPDAGMYTKALDFIQVKPSEAMMVAAHAYDLRAARKV